jgi:hypothetical protein
MIKFDSDEHILFEVRKHWFVFVRQIFIPSVLVIVPLSFIAEMLKDPMIPTQFVWFCYVAWLLIFWCYVFIVWTNFFLDVWIITNKKLIYIEQWSLFSRQISTLQLTKIQDVTTDVSGIIPTFLGFGNLKVQTAGQEKEFVIRNIVKPNLVRQRLNDAIDKYIHEVRGIDGL